MSEPTFLRVCALSELPPGRRRVVVLDEERQVALFNIAGTIHAVTNICPHQHSPVIVDGMVEDCTVTCPLHGWQYDLATGQALGGGARLRTYEVRIIDADVYVEEPKEEVPGWWGGVGS